MRSGKRRSGTREMGEGREEEKEDVEGKSE